MAAMASQKEESVSPDNTTDVDKEKSTDQDVSRQQTHASWIKVEGAIITT